MGEILRESAQRDPEHTAIIYGDEKLSYAELDRRADRFANALLGLGLEDRSKVAILARNCLPYAIAYFAIARTNLVSAHCSTRLIAGELAYVLDKVEARVLLFESQFAPIVEGALAQVDRSVRPIVVDRAATPSDLPAGTVAMDSFMDAAPTGAPTIALNEDRPLAITMTGGTTGFPKAVLVTHRARYASATAAAAEFGLDRSDIVTASTPLFHTAGLFVWFVTAIMLGATVVLLDSWRPDNFISTVSAEGVTAAFLVPSQLNHLISDPAFDAERLNSLRKVSYAGAPMSRALYDRIQAALPHVEFTENYGQSEACPITIRRPGQDDRHLATVGRPAINAEIGIVDREGRFLQVGETGDIVTRGEQLFSEYFNDPEETAGAFRMPDGWLLTGDVGFIDESGFLTLVDRSKDMLVSGGENVYPAEIENVLYRHDAVAECAVIGIPDEEWGEVAAAHVVLKPDAAITEQGLIDFCADNMSRFKRPRVIRFETSLPKTAIGKIRKNVLREPYWKDHERNI